MPIQQTEHIKTVACFIYGLIKVLLLKQFSSGQTGYIILFMHYTSDKFVRLHSAPWTQAACLMRNLYEPCIYIVIKRFNIKTLKTLGQLFVQGPDLDTTALC